MSCAHTSKHIGYASPIAQRARHKEIYSYINLHLMSHTDPVRIYL
uniref:Uncharacterized protein n=1 Tax=Anguilla anguilla TaxID=7936 RepID=A0A0E9X5P1_ANGAN